MAVQAARPANAKGAGEGRATRSGGDPAGGLVWRFRLTVFSVAVILVLASVTAAIGYTVYGRLTEANFVAAMERDTAREANHLLEMAAAGRSARGADAPGEAEALSWLVGPAGLPDQVRSIGSGLNIVQVALYDTSGELVWSSTPGDNGSEEDELDEMSRALGGIASANLHRGTVVRDSTGEARQFDAVSTFVPVRAREGGPVVGVLEAYRDVTEEFATMVSGQRGLTTRTVVPALAGLALALLTVAVVADTVIHRSGRRAAEAGRLLRADLSRQNELLRASEERLRAVTSNLPLVLFATDSEGRFTFSDGRGLEALGWRGRDRIGRSVFDLYPDVPEITSAFRTALGGAPAGTTVEVGGVTWEHRYEPLVGEDGAVTGVVGVGLDVTARERAVDDLRREVRERAVLGEIGRVVNSDLDLGSIYERMADVLTPVLVFDRLAVTTHEPEGDRLVFFRGEPVGGAAIGDVTPHMPECEHGSGKLWDSAETGWTAGPGRDIGEHSCMRVPLMQAGATSGHLSLMTFRAGAYDRRDLASLERVAAQVAPAIANARLYEELRIRGAALDAAAEMVMITDRDGVIEYVNDAFVSGTGFGREEAVGARPDILRSGQDDPAIFRGMWETIAAGRVWSGVVRNRRKDGSVYPEEMTITPVPPRSRRPERFIAIKRDITERLRAHEEHEQRERLAAQNRELQRVNEARSQFLSTVSHELKTPLTSLLAFADIIARNRDGNLTARQVSQLDVVKRSGRRLSDLIEDLLDVSRIDSGRLKLEMAEFDAGELLREISGSMAPLLEAKGQRLETEVPARPMPVVADRRRLGQVVINLVSNASKYSPEGAPVALRAEWGEKALRLRVEDRGIGIAPEDQRRLFTPFFRAANEATRAQQGTGLGLVIVKSIIEQHGGTVTLESAPGAGTTVRVEVPARPVAAELAGRERHAA